MQDPRDYQGHSTFGICHHIWALSPADQYGPGHPEVDSFWRLERCFVSHQEAHAQIEYMVEVSPTVAKYTHDYISLECRAGCTCGPDGIPE